MCRRGAARAACAPDAPAVRAARSTPEEAARKARPDPELAILEPSVRAAAAPSAPRRQGAGAPAQGARGDSAEPRCCRARIAAKAGQRERATTHRRPQPARSGPWPRVCPSGSRLTCPPGPPCGCAAAALRSEAGIRREGCNSRALPPQPGTSPSSRLRCTERVRRGNAPSAACVPATRRHAPPSAICSTGHRDSSAAGTTRVGRNVRPCSSRTPRPGQRGCPRCTMRNRAAPAPAPPLVSPRRAPRPPPPPSFHRFRLALAVRRRLTRRAAGILRVQAGLEVR